MVILRPLSGASAGSWLNVGGADADPRTVARALLGRIARCGGCSVGSRSVVVVFGRAGLTDVSYQRHLELVEARLQLHGDQRDRPVEQPLPARRGGLREQADATDRGRVEGIAQLPQLPARQALAHR